MVLMSFSEPEHVPMLLDGRKQQTTRKPRKNPVRHGDTLHCYYLSRMKKDTCTNCLTPSTLPKGCSITETGKCPGWNNLFGKALVTHVWTTKITTLSSEEKEQWAIADGFKDFAHADKWFTASHGPGWQDEEWDIIYFMPGWLKKGGDSQ